jgi:hypothetical protein
MFRLILVLLLCAPAYGQERMKSSEGWHVDGSELTQGCGLIRHHFHEDDSGRYYRVDTLGYRFDLSRVFIEDLITIKADTCRECPEGYEVAYPIKDNGVEQQPDTVCLRKRVVDRSGGFRWTADTIGSGSVMWDPIPPDTVWDFADLKTVIRPKVVDTVWRVIPEGFTKAEWLKLWGMIKPPAVANAMLIQDADTLMIGWGATKAELLDSLDAVRIHNNVILIDSVPNYGGRR